MNTEKLINYQFTNTELLACALTHSSYANEQKLNYNNEKLEYLGDAVLDLVIGDLLFRSLPDSTEGQLSRLRASLVNEDKLAEVAKKIDLHHFVNLGRGEVKVGGQTRPRLLASCLEALVGAIYKDGGYQSVYNVISELFNEVLQEALHSQDYSADYKTRLQEVVQQDLKVTPTYKTLGTEGPAHQRDFKVVVLAGEQILGEGEGSSKKMAEQMAAKDALIKIK